MVINSGYSSMFSSFGNNSFTVGNSMTSLDFSTLSSIKNGSYKKLLNAYYKKQNTNNTDTTTSTKTDKTSSKKNTNAVSVRDEAKAVGNSIENLNKESLWKKTTIKNEDGTTQEEYDKDAIYKAVSSFVKEYNTLLDSASKSDDNSVLRTTANMVGKTRANKEFLAKMGISVGTNNKLTVDEETFKESSMLDVKDAFKGTGSYGKSIESSASMIYGSASAQIARQTSSGMYLNSGYFAYQNGSYFNQFI